MTNEKSPDCRKCKGHDRRDTFDICTYCLGDSIQNARRNFRDLGACGPIGRYFQAKEKVTQP